MDFVNPYIGNISHMLRPTDPTVDLPNGMMRMTPDRIGFTSETIGGFPLVVTAHRGASAFQLRPYEGNDNSPPAAPHHYTYDQEKTTPYRYSVYLDQQGTNVAFAPARKSAIYTFGYEAHDFGQHLPHGFVLSVRRGELKAGWPGRERVRVARRRWDENLPLPGTEREAITGKLVSRRGRQARREFQHRTKHQRLATSLERPLQTWRSATAYRT